MIRIVPLRLARWLVSAAVVMPLLGCAAPRSYMGIDVSPSATSRLSVLARTAAEGDKQAQFELGGRFESGRGVPPDLARARQLYAAAASSTPATTPIWVPGTGGVPGRVLIVKSGIARPGLPEARERLTMLDGRK